MNHEKATVEFDGEVVRKRQPHELVLIEAAKTRAAGEVASSTKAFRVPQVVDARAGELVLELVRGLGSIRPIADDQVWCRVGEALAPCLRSYIGKNIFPIGPLFKWTSLLAL